MRPSDVSEADLSRKTSRFVRRSKHEARQFERSARAEMRETKSELKKNIDKASWWYGVFRLSLVTVFYFCSSVALTFYQKDLIASIPYPLSMVILHLVIKFLLALLSRRILPRCSRAKASANRRNSQDQDRVVLPWGVYLQKITLVACSSAWDIGLSQWSLQFVTVALYTMGKTTSILFILMFGLAFKLEKKHWSQIVIVLLISAGIGLFNYKSTSFSLFGFVMVIGASLMSGLRWTLSQLIMQRSALQLNNPVDMIYHVQPLMIASLLPLVVVIEGVSLSGSSLGFRFHSYGELLHTMALVFAGGILAFCMELSEYLIVNMGSSLTLAIVGVSKEIVTVSISLLRNHVKLSTVNSAGLFVCLLGIVSHSVRKASQRQEQTESAPMELSALMLSDSSDEDEGLAFSAGDASTRLRKSASAKPLLEVDQEPFASDDDDAVLAKAGHSRGGRRWVSVGDEFFLRENRTWTSVRDSHVASMKGLESGKSSSAIKEDTHEPFVNNLISSD